MSSAFMVKEKGHSLELIATLININPGHNETLMDSCKTLKDYVEYTEKVRVYAKTLALEDAVEMAITECIQDDILAEFLRKNRAEAKNVSIYEYDEEKHMRQVREEGREEGERNKLIQLIQLIQTKLRKGKSIETIADELEESVDIVRELIEKTKR